MKLSACTYALLIVLMCGIAPAQVCADEVAVTATVDRATATLEDAVLLSVTVEGTKEQPSLSGLDDFRVTPRGTSSQVRIVNGRMSSSYQFNYLLQPEKTGTFTIGPFTVAHKKATYASNTITLTVSQQAAGSEHGGREVFVTAAVDNDHPYVHERIVYTFKFFRRVQVGNARLTAAPDFEGFVSESLGKEREYRSVINGQAYTVTELRWALYPARSGVAVIGASTLDCDLVIQQRRGRGGFFDDPFFDDSFFGFGTRTAPKSLRTEPVTVMVHQLPAAGRPPGFIRLVGEFELSGVLSDASVHAGDSATLTLTLSGRGNLRSMPAIDLPVLPDVKVYDDKPVFVPDQTGGTLTVKKALVPMKQGSLTIPPVEVAYFNPKEEKYMSARTAPFSLQVLPARQTETLQAIVPGVAGAAKEDVRVLGQDILPIYTGPDVLTAAHEERLNFLHGILLAAPVVLYVVCVFMYNTRARRRAGSARARSRSAWPRFRKRLHGLRAAMQHGSDDFFGEAGRALRDFVGDRLGVSGSALTPSEITSLICDVGVDPHLTDRVRHVLDQCDAGCYGSVAGDAASRQELIKEISAVAHVLRRRI